MKRYIPILLAVLLLCGCGVADDGADTVTFYYLRSEIQYGAGDGVIAPETRELPGSGADLTYLLSLYMRGPVEESLLLPLPTGTRLTDILQEDGTLTLTFSPELSGLEGTALPIACACIGYTCFSLTDAETVVILAPAADSGAPVSFTVTRDTFLLFDSTTKEADAS